MDRWRDDPYEADTTDERLAARSGTRPGAVRARSGARAATRADSLDERFGGRGFARPNTAGDRVGPSELFAPADEEDEEPGGRRLTPFRVAVTIALVGSLAAIAYALFVERGGTQIPILVSGMAVFGVSLVVLSAAGAMKSVRAAQDGYGARAFWAALLGGICAIAAAGSLGGAVVLALVWRSAA